MPSIEIVTGLRQTLLGDGDGKGGGGGLTAEALATSPKGGGWEEGEKDRGDMGSSS